MRTVMVWTALLGPLLGPMMLTSSRMSAHGEPPAGERPDWRSRRVARIDVSPDPSKIEISTASDGWARITGRAGAAADGRARMVRVMNLATADQVAAAVSPDGSFEARLFAPPGSTLQINTSMLSRGELPPEWEAVMRTRGQVTPSDTSCGEMFDGMIGSHVTSSPALVIPVWEEREADGRTLAFVKKVARECWLWGRVRASATEVAPGQLVDLEVTLSLELGSRAAARSVPRKPPTLGLTLHRLFDQDGRQRSAGRQPISDVLTPTGLPIETHGEMIAEPRPDGRMQWHLGGTGLPVPWWFDDAGEWRMEARRPTITQHVKLEIPEQTPPGRYALQSAIWGVGDEEFFSGEPVGGPWCLAYLAVGNPGPPRLTCLLLGSVGSGGARGAVAREDRRQFAINTKVVYTPEKLIIPRDDAYTRKPRRYPLDPYIPHWSTAHRPAPAIPNPLIPLDFERSRLEVVVTGPGGEVETLGPAPLVAGQNDLSVLRPDYVFPDRILAPVAPTYGNPSASDIYHVSGRGAFDYAFSEYGHYQVELRGRIADLMGTDYRIAGTYDVYVARPLDIDVFPEPGTPLEPGVAIHPQIRILPALPAEVEICWRRYPSSDNDRVVERRLVGRANRWGVLVPGSDQPAMTFGEPGEYVCDVTARHEDEDGVLWMACRKGASVVVTPESKVVVHGERGNRSPTARWRARWFVAGDNRFVAPPPSRAAPPPLPPDAPPEERLNRVDLGHTCLPYEPGDVAWLGHTMAFSLFPGLTFEDPQGTISALIERRWPEVRQGAGREGLYPHELKPEDRRAIGELPYVCMTAGTLPPSMRPDDVVQWGYFYTTSWRPGVAVRSLVAEDAQPVGYWFFDDPYAYQFGNGPQGDLPGDVKMNYGGGVFRDRTAGVAHYGGYASMLVLIDGHDPRGARVLPPFDGIVPGSPPCGPLLEIGGRQYDVFLTFAAVAPGAVLQVGDRLSIAGVVWPPVEGHVEGEIVAPSGGRVQYKTRSGPMGVFDYAGPVVKEPGVWKVRAEGVCTGKTSVGRIADLVPEARWPRGGGVGLEDSTFSIPVVSRDAKPIAFDLPAGARAKPPLPLVIRGRLPRSSRAETADVVVSLPGQVVDRRAVSVDGGVFEYVYDPWQLKQSFPNIDTRIEMPQGGFEHAPAWYDTVVFTFWAGRRDKLAAGTVLLQGEKIHAHTTTGSPMPVVPKGGFGQIKGGPAPARPPRPPAVGRPGGGGPHSSLLALTSSGRTLLAAHPWSGEVVRLDVRGRDLSVTARARTGGEPRCVALSPDETIVYSALADAAEVVALDARSLGVVKRFEIEGSPRAALPSADGKALFVADFDGGRVLRLNSMTGKIEARSPPINRPACLALSSDRNEVYTVSFRTGEVVILDEHCAVARRLAAPSQLNQCGTLTLDPDGLLFAPQTRSDPVAGGQMFDRSVFPAIAVCDPLGKCVTIGYFPDLLVVPPHRPAEVAVDRRRVYLASAGSDDVLAIDRETGFAEWHAQGVGLEPGAIALDGRTSRLYVLTITGQEIIALDADTGQVLSRRRFTEDPTPPRIARGRYLFGTATDKRLTKDQWMSCAVCHPDGDEDGRQWDLGAGPLDTRSLRGCLRTTPLHVDGHMDEIQDTYDFTRMVMAGQWFLPLHLVHGYLGDPNAGMDPDLDALAAYVAGLAYRKPPAPPAELLPVIERGEELFFSEQTGCADCHPPPYYTDSGARNADGGFLLHDVGTALRSGREPSAGFDTPSLLGLGRSEPYLHDGRARTIEEVLTKFNPQDRHGQVSHLSPEDVHALAEFLRYLSPPPVSHVTPGSPSAFRRAE